MAVTQADRAELNAIRDSCLRFRNPAPAGGGVKQAAADISVMDLAAIDIFEFDDTALAASVARLSHSSAVIW